MVPQSLLRERIEGKILNLALKILDITHDGTSPSTQDSIARGESYG